MLFFSHFRRFLLRFFQSPAPDSGLATLEEATMQIVSWRLVLGTFFVILCHYSLAVVETMGP